MTVTVFVHCHSNTESWFFQPDSIKRHGTIEVQVGQLVYATRRRRQQQQPPAFPSCTVAVDARRPVCTSAHEEPDHHTALGCQTRERLQCSVKTTRARSTGGVPRVQLQAQETHTCARTHTQCRQGGGQGGKQERQVASVVCLRKLIGQNCQYCRDALTCVSVTSRTGPVGAYEGGKRRGWGAAPD